LTTKECHKQHRFREPKNILNRARKVLRGKNFVTTKHLAKLLKIKGQAASRILVNLPEWNKYGARSWAREGYPL
jgi:ribosomal protein S25